MREHESAVIVSNPEHTSRRATSQGTNVSRGPASPPSCAPTTARGRVCASPGFEVFDGAGDVRDFVEVPSLGEMRADAEADCP